MSYESLEEKGLEHGSDHIARLFVVRRACFVSMSTNNGGRHNDDHPLLIASLTSLTQAKRHIPPRILIDLLSPVSLFALLPSHPHPYIPVKPSFDTHTPFVLNAVCRLGRRLLILLSLCFSGNSCPKPREFIPLSPPHFFWDIIAYGQLPASQCWAVERSLFCGSAELHR